MIEETALRKARILVIEDNPADVELLRLALKSAELDCELTLLEDGAEAIALMQQCEESALTSIPDLAVLDLNLPKNGGLEVLEAIRGSRMFHTMPVAVLSSSSSPRERAKLDEFGVAKFITKPLDLEAFLGIGSVLKSLVRESLSREQSPAGKAQPAS